MIKRNDDSKSRVAWQLFKLETIAAALILLAVDGNAQAIFGRDTVPPVITIAASPSVLWPANGGLVQVTVSGQIGDASLDTGSPAFSVRDEYGTVQPRGTIVIGPDGYSFTILLQASRDDQDVDGRSYSITVTASDDQRNVGRAETSVVVPHDAPPDLIK